MRRVTIAGMTVALALAACSGDMSTGTSTPGNITPPVNVQPQASGMPGVPGAPGSTGSTIARPGTPTAMPSAPPGDTGTYAFADAANGLRCPEVNGYSCILHLNAPAATMNVKPSSSPTLSASPSPSPSPTASASMSPAPSPSTTPSVTLKLEAQPKDAPSMVNPDPKAVATTPLIALRLQTSADVSLTGTASADFILPPSQLGGRGFAVQLFYETIGHHNKRTDRFIGSYSKSTITGGALHFAITPPTLTIKHTDTWLFVLYGDELPVRTEPSMTPAPSTSPSEPPAASPTPAVAPSP